MNHDHPKEKAKCDFTQNSTNIIVELIFTQKKCLYASSIKRAQYPYEQDEEKQL